MKIKIITPLGEFESTDLEAEEIDDYANKFFTKNGFVSLYLESELGTWIIPVEVAKKSIFLTI